MWIARTSPCSPSHHLSHPTHIYICPPFWKTEDKTFSQAGSLVHELSHLIANTNSGMKDLPGYWECRKLACEKPKSSIGNADNYKFYVQEFWPNVLVPPRPRRRVESNSGVGLSGNDECDAYDAISDAQEITDASALGVQLTGQILNAIWGV